MAGAKQNTGEIVRYTGDAVDGAVEGVPELLAGHTLFVVPVTTEAASAAVNGYTTGAGKFRLPKKAATAFAEGDLCYWNPAGGVVSEDPTEGLFLGVCANPGGKVAGDALIDVLSMSQGVEPEMLVASFDAVANDTVAFKIVAPFDCVVQAIEARCLTAPASGAGDVDLAMLNGTGGNTMLVAATFDAETLVADTLTTLTLTATGADLELDKGQAIAGSLVSDNADMTGGADFVILVHVRHRVG